MLLSLVAATALLSAPLSTRETRADPSARLMLQAGFAFGTGALAVPASFVLAQNLGTLSNQLVFALVPALLVMGLLPALTVSFMSWMLRNADLDEGESRGPFLLPFLATTVVNIGVMVAGGFLGVSLANLASVVVLSLVDALLMTGANVGTMRLFARPPAAPAPVAFAPWAPVATTTF